MTDTKKPAPPWHTTFENENGRTQLRRTLLVDYLEARELAEAAKNGTEEQTLLRGQQYGAMRALAQFLVHASEFKTLDAATEAIAHRRVVGMPQPNKDYSKVVPF